jgi:hypothetical protein
LQAIAVVKLECNALREEPSVCEADSPACQVTSLQYHVEEESRNKEQFQCKRVQEKSLMSTSVTDIASASPRFVLASI